MRTVDLFIRTRDFFRESLSEIESGRAKLVDLKDGFDELDSFIENATMCYLTTSALISDAEMDEILSDQELVKSLKNGLQEVARGEYKYQ